MAQGRRGEGGVESGGVDVGEGGVEGGGDVGRKQQSATRAREEGREEGYDGGEDKWGSQQPQGVGVARRMANNNQL
jgi:hypothetical protein